MVRMRHYKEVMTELAPRLIRYSIPLHLPAEQMAFRSHTLLVSIQVPEVPTKICLEDLKKISFEARQVHVTVEPELK